MYGMIKKIEELNSSHYIKYDYTNEVLCIF